LIERGQPDHRHTDHDQHSTDDRQSANEEFHPDNSTVFPRVSPGSNASMPAMLSVETSEGDTDTPRANSASPEDACGGG
jgi:hypothetical protein